MSARVFGAIVLMVFVAVPRFATAQVAKPAPASAGSGDSIVITVKEGQSVRELAQEYLGDANLWNEILKFNKLTSATEVRPGSTLRIPSSAVSLAGKAIARLDETIQNATKYGAALFAGDAIRQAIDLRDQALKKRKAGEWEVALKMATDGQALADVALKKSESQRNVAGEAVLYDVKGTAQIRKESSTVWRDMAVNDVMVEGERIRTLSSSYAEIRFRDGSRLRLNENSQAVIQKMRVNVLEQKAESSVSLVSGDAYALLEGNQQKKTFNLELESSKAQVKVRSTKFWVSKDAKKARFANYDGELEVSSGSSTVVLKENQGSVVEGDKKPAVAKDLLPVPDQIGPDDNIEQFVSSATFTWKPVEGAAFYWLEIATDKAFKKIVVTERTLKKPEYTKSDFAEGAYYWRVAAIDEDDFPGPKSAIRLLQVTDDKLPPLLVIRAPASGSVVSNLSVTLQGETEPDAKMYYNDTLVDVDTEGKFHLDATLVAGNNEFIFKATDRAGNITTVKHQLIFSSNRPIFITYDAVLPARSPKNFVSNRRLFTIIGKSEADVMLAVQSETNDFNGNFSSDANGDFRFNVPVPHDAAKRNFRVSLTAAGGRFSGDAFSIEYDPNPPEISFAEDVPATTNERRVALKGTCSDVQTMTINNENVLFDGEHFAHTLDLQNGNNELVIIARDRAGNITTVKRNIILDQEPPRIVKSTLSVMTATGGEQVVVRVKASDATGFKKAARFVLSVGEFNYTGYLKFLRTEQTYQGTVRLPGYAKGKTLLKSVRLADYLGNQAEYRFK